MMSKATRARFLVTVTVGLGACAGEPITSPIAERVITGRVVAPVSADFTLLHARWTNGGGGDSVRVAADGTFTMRVPDGTGEVELVIDQQGGGPFHPFLHPLNPDSVQSFTAVLVPRMWTVQKGIYAGEAVDVSLDLVMDEPATSPTYFNVRRVPPRDTVSVGLKAWSPELFPMRVALDHEHSTRAITPADSVAIWSVFDRMEVVFGENLFEPVVAEPSWFPTPDPVTIHRVIRVRFRSPIIGAAGVFSTAPIDRRRVSIARWATGGSAPNYVLERTWVDSGELGFGVGAEPPMGWHVVYAHEMLHILGVGHTSRIPSPQGPAMRTEEPSKFDVAYIEMLRAVMLLEREHQTHLGIVPATMGQRRLELDLPLLPLMPLPFGGGA